MSAPLVSVLLAVRDGSAYVRSAIASVLGQTMSDFELLVVDDASADETPAILASIEDARLRVLRNDERLGLAGSLNRALDEARGRYVARLDADDVALPWRLERQVHRLRATRTAVVGSAVLELDEAGNVGQLHVMPVSSVDIRWVALFSSPFFHPTVVVDGELLARHGLRYDVDFDESEDYELWSRVLSFADGSNSSEALVLYRVHPEQASQRRRGIQRSFQLRVARRAIASICPDLSHGDAELAWRVGAHEDIAGSEVKHAADAYRHLLDCFEARFGRAARERAATDLLRLSRRIDGSESLRIAASALKLDPRLPVQVARRRGLRTVRASRDRHGAELLARRLAAENGARRIRVAAVFPEPTPYRAPLLDRVAASPEIDLKVIYAAATVADRTWRVDFEHDAVFLPGVRLPGANRVLHHDYPLTPGVVGELSATGPDVVVVSGWSTFAAQAAIAWCGVHRTPYVLVVESHDAGPRARWRRAVKGTFVPHIVRHAAGVLVTGALARDSMIARGAAPSSVRRFANTIDVEGFASSADAMRQRRTELRTGLGVDDEHVVVLCVARLGVEKRIDHLVEAVSDADDSRLVIVAAGEGPERQRVERRARDLGVRLVLLGDVQWERVVELYVAADIFALLSERETWAVVVNEAAACGLPLVLSDRVGAAHDLLRDGENGRLVTAGDVRGAAEAFRELASDRELRRAWGERSRELSRDWGYGPSVDGFLEAVREALSDRR